MSLALAMVTKRQQKQVQEKWRFWRWGGQNSMWMLASQMKETFLLGGLYLDDAEHVLLTAWVAIYHHLSAAFAEALASL